jgi:hypothetical protein
MRDNLTHPRKVSLPRSCQYFLKTKPFTVIIYSDIEASDLELEDLIQELRQLPKHLDINRRTDRTRQGQQQVRVLILAGAIPPPANPLD